MQPEHFQATNEEKPAYLRPLERGEKVRVLDRAEVIELNVVYVYSNGNYALSLPPWNSHQEEERDGIYAAEETPRLIRALERIEKEVTTTLKRVKEQFHDNEGTTKTSPQAIHDWAGTPAERTDSVQD